jgi:hypothetical protein
MAALRKIPSDLAVIAETFKLERSLKCTHLEKWLKKSYQLNSDEQQLIESIHAEMTTSIDYLNESELKIRLIAPLFMIAKIDEGDKVRVFYERKLSVKFNDFEISVISDCIIASSIFKKPSQPYFYIQEFQKIKGKKRDPEAQMLLAMLAAQKSNNDGKPIYGGFLIGSVWQLTTLINNQFCASRQYSATNKEDLMQIAYALRHLKALIMNG